MKIQVKIQINSARLQDYQTWLGGDLQQNVIWPNDAKYTEI